MMITDEEKAFMEYWKKNRERESKLGRQLFFGLPLGILMGIGIVLSLITGWYTRAVMEANSQLNPIVLIIALLSIAVFTSIFYKKHRWEMNEQYYKELLHKKNKRNPPANAANH